MKPLPHCLFFCLIGLARLWASAEPALPEIPEGAPAIMLIPATKEQAVAAPAFGRGPVFYGTLAENNAEEIRATPQGMVVLRRAGYQDGRALFRWEWPSGTTPSGRYALWTLFTQGGKSAQAFAVSVGSSGSHLEERVKFSQTSNSWDMVWRKAPEELVLYPNDRLLTLRINGMATQQRQFAGFLLVKEGELPAGASNEESLAVERALNPEPLVAGAPTRWLTVGTWAGPAGISLWGLDYEAEVRPFPGALEPVLRFDNGRVANWTETAPDASGRVVIEKLAHNNVWSKGSGYAHVYLQSPKAGRVTLRFGHTGGELQGWLNGRALDWKSDASPDAVKVAGATAGGDQADLNDQGGVVVVQEARGARSHVATLDLKEGWNRLLVKPIVRQQKGEEFAFAARFSANDSDLLQGLRTSLKNPVPAAVSRTVASRYVPTVRTNVPFNLAHEGEPLTLTVDLGEVDKLAKLQRPPAGSLADGLRLELRVTDYDGREVLRRAQPFELPGKADFDLGPAPARGYYAVHARLLDREGNLVVAYPTDGFSVIGGVAAQRERKADKKMAVTYYFMAGRDLHQTLYFPYMQRIGIFRNIGGHNTRRPEFFKEAAAQGLFVMADMWNHKSADYVRAYVEESAPYVDSFKSYNEIDIKKNIRGTPESWVAKAKQEYEIIKSVKPEAVMVGGSLVRPASDDWFEECLKLGLANYHDVWDVHCYPQRPPVLEGTMSNSPNETELGVLKVYAKLGMKNDKPFWIGETGARSSHGNDARRWQAEMVAKMTACALSRKDFEKIGFLVPWWYARERGTHLVGDIEAGHMPAEASYYTASALIDGFAYTRLSLGEDVQAARFGPTVMAWTTGGKARTITVRPEGAAPFVKVDVVGRVSQVEARDGAVSIEASTSPVYVLSRAAHERLTRTE